MVAEPSGWLHDERREARRRQGGFALAQLLDLPEGLRELLIAVTRQEPVTLTELGESLERNPVELELQVSQLVAQGWLDVQENDSGQWVYRAQLAPGGKRILPPGIWQVLDQHWQVPVFRLFPEPVREGFSRHFQLQTCKAGTVLFEAGTWGDRMYIVETGKVELVVHNQAGQKFVLQEVGAGEVLGETAVLLGERRPCTAQVVEDAQVWVLAKTDLDRLLRRHPLVGITVRRELSRHLRSSSSGLRPKARYNPVIAVGGASADLARCLALQTSGEVVLLDLDGSPPPGVPNLTYVDGRAMHSRAVVEVVQHHLERHAWVLVAAPARMVEQLTRVVGLAGLIVDMTSTGAPWLRATARECWSLPSPSAAQVSRLARRLTGRLTGLVLSGGYARSVAHLGVLEVLQSSDVPIDAIASCSYGALWSVLYAADWSPAQMIELAVEHASKLRSWGRWPGLRAGSQAGLYDGRAVRGWVGGLVGGLGFSDLSIPCTLATSDLLSGEVVWIKEGRVFNALAACVAVPNLVTPVRYQDRWLADSILQDPLPADALAERDADIVLASTVIPFPGADDRRTPAEASPPDLATGWLAVCGAIAHERAQDHLNRVDLVIAPDLVGFSDQAFERAPELIERGRQAAKEALPHIRALLRREE